jgi:hypothetical protein
MLRINAWHVSLTLTPLVLGCSLLRDLSVDQCTQDSDCSRFGNYTCSAERVCVARASNGGSPGDGGQSGSSGSAGQGAGGGVVEPECQTNADCIDAHEGAPYICKDEACVSLTTETHCPFVIAGPEGAPTEYLTGPGKPIIFGAYVPISVSAPESHPYTLNYRFALEEFMDGTLGGVGQPKRPFAMVLCQSSDPDLEASLGHLIDTLEVPSILASLPSDNLSKAYNIVSTKSRKVFLLGPLEADAALAAQEDEGRLWHMIGPATDLIPVKSMFAT